MSRIGKQPIAIPAKVKVEVKGQKVHVEGPKGKLDWELPKRTTLKVDGTNVIVSRDGEDAQAKALHGLSRALVNNMVKGVTDGFVKKLEIQGVRYPSRCRGFEHAPLSQAVDRRVVSVERTLACGRLARAACSFPRTPALSLRSRSAQEDSA